MLETDATCEEYGDPTSVALTLNALRDKIRECVGSPLENIFLKTFISIKFSSELPLACVSLREVLASC